MPPFHAIKCRLHSTKCEKYILPSFIQIWRVEEELHFSLTLVLGEGEWLASGDGRLTPGEKAHSNHLIWGWKATESVWTFRGTQNNFRPYRQSNLYIES
jgi:hypothetical protein